MEIIVPSRAGQSSFAGPRLSKGKVLSSKMGGGESWILPSSLGLFALLCACVPLTSAFYLPGSHPNEFEPEISISVKISRVASSKSHADYDLYDMPFCQPPSTVENLADLEESAFGETYYSASYDLKAMKNESCKLLCIVPDFADQGEPSQLFLRLMKEGAFHVKLRADGLPAIRITDITSAASSYTDPNVLKEDGYQIGYHDMDDFYVNNHINFYIHYHPVEPATDDEPVKARIVNVHLTTASVQTTPGEIQSCEMRLPPQKAAGHVMFTYSVYFLPSDIAWASRWDALRYMPAGNSAPVLYPLVNATILCFSLAGVLAFSMIRALRRDLAAFKDQYISLDRERGCIDKLAEQSSWEALAYDVFRPPRSARMLSVAIGTGAQLFFTMITVLFAAVFGFSSPPTRGTVMNIAFVVCVSFGSLAGYCAARTYRLFNRPGDWETVILRTATLFPTVIFAALFVLNSALSGYEASGAVPSSKLLVICALWFGLSVPLVFLGAQVGFGSSLVEFPIKVATTPRELPLAFRTWYQYPVVQMVVGAAILFGVAAVQASVLLTDLWLQHYLVMFCFLLAAVGLVAIVSAEVSIIAVYLLLGAQDYRWWWTSFLVPAFSGVYMFIAICARYLPAAVATSAPLTVSLLMTYAGVVSLVFGLAAGAIGFYASFTFVWGIYSRVKDE